MTGAPVQVNLGSWTVGELDGRKVDFSLVLKTGRIVGTGHFSVIEGATGAYFAIVLWHPQNATTRIELTQAAVDSICRADARSFTCR